MFYLQQREPLKTYISFHVSLRHSTYIHETGNDLQFLTFIGIVVILDDLEYLADLGLGIVPLRPLLELVKLLHLEMLWAPDVHHEEVLSRGAELTEGAVV